MFRRVLGHVRRQPVAFVALFFALGGGAMAASTVIKSTDTIPAGDLAGSTYGDPVIAARAVTDSKVAAANIDGTASTPSMRTLGSGAQQALPGNALPGGPPTGAAGGDLIGTYPNPTIANGAVTDAKVAPANVDGAASTPSLRTLGTGAQQAMPGNAHPGPSSSQQAHGACQLAAGNTYCYAAPAFTPASNGVCIVSVETAIGSAGNASPASDGPALRIAVSRGGTNGDDGFFAADIEASPGASAFFSSPSARTMVVPVTGGQSTQFGALYGAANSDWAGKPAFFATGYACWA